MRKILVALIAIGVLAVAGVLVAAPKSASKGSQASVMSLDIFGITQKARDLPEQSYPSH